MTMVTIVAIAVIGGILALMWDPITNWIQDSFGGAAGETAGDSGYQPEDFDMGP